MTFTRRLLVAFLTLAPACAQPDDPGAVASTAPAIGKADGTDSASRACEITLRDATRAYGDDGNYATDCASGTCLYAWNGSIDVAETAWQDGASVHLLYHRTTDGTWWDVAAEAQRAAVPSYRRFGFTISEHLFGPAEADAGVEIEMVAYLALPGGGRLFDHNRFTGDFENYRMTPGDGWYVYDAGICQPTVAHINFDVNGGSAYNDLRQDGWIMANYALDRLPECRGAGWDTVGYAYFFPGAQLVQQSLRSFTTASGEPTTTAEAVPFMVDIPDDATAVELWFSNFADGCQTWDSSYGANFRYIVRGTPGNPARCDGYTLSVANYTQPVCLGYDLAGQFDADHCELHLDGIGHAYEAHYGIPHEWLEVYLHAGPNDGTVENIGMRVRYHDAAGTAHEQFQLGSAISPGIYKMMLDLSCAYGGTQNTVDQMAFFIDVRRPSKKVVRLWQSRHGANYTMADAFTLPTTSSMIPYGHAEWANDASPIYDSRNACN
jgi:hypothetical protein